MLRLGEPLPVSPTLLINERVHEAQAAGRELFHFGFGESRFPAPTALTDALARAASQTEYPPVAGLGDLRAAIAAYYSVEFDADLDADQVVVAPGSKALLFGLLKAFGRDVILPTPSWVSYEPQARMCGLAVHRLPGDPGRSYEWTLDDLGRTLDDVGPGGAVLLVNSPNNPTGRMFSDDFVEQLGAFARARDLPIISDEIYGLVAAGGVDHHSVSRELPESTVVCTGLSKHLSLGGWRLGVAILPSVEGRLRQRLVGIASEIWSAAPAPIQAAAVTAYERRADVEDYIEACASLHAARTRRMWEGLTAAGIRCPEPQGAFYLMPDFEAYRPGLAGRSITTSQQLSASLLDDIGIATLPGEAFGFPPEMLAIRMASSYIDLENKDRAAALLAGWNAAGRSPDYLDGTLPRMDQAIERLGQFASSLR